MIRIEACSRPRAWARVSDRFDVEGDRARSVSVAIDDRSVVDVDGRARSNARAIASERATELEGKIWCADGGCVDV